MAHLQTQVLTVLGDQGRLDLPQIAAIGRLSLGEVQEALDGLVREGSVTVRSGKVGSVYEVNPERLRELVEEAVA